MERSLRSQLLLASSTAKQSKLEAEPSKREEAWSLALKYLDSALESLSTCREQRSSSSPIPELRSPELLVEAAEVCLTCQSALKARSLAEDYFRHVQGDDSPDQYYVRALFVMGFTESQLPPATPPPIDTAAPADRSLEILSGSEALRRTLRSTKFILKALSFTTSRPSYYFLAYNASVCFWNVARPAMRDGARKYLAPGLMKIYDALETIDDKDLSWRVQVGIALVRSLDEAGEYTVAAQRVAQVMLLAKRYLEGASADTATASTAHQIAVDETKRIIKEMRSREDQPEDNEEEKKSPRDTQEADEPMKSLEELESDLLTAERNQSALESEMKMKKEYQTTVLSLVQRVALLRLDVGRNGAINGDCKKLLDEAEKDDTVFLNGDRAALTITLQKLRSGILDGKDEKDKLTGAENSLMSLLSTLSPADPENPDAEPDVPADAFDFIVDAGRIASRFSFNSFAQSCIDKCKSTKLIGSPAFRIKLDYLKCEVLAKELDEKTSITEDVSGASSESSKAKTGKLSLTKEKLPPAKLDSRHVSALRLSRRVEALKLLDRTIMSARRLGDPNLLEEGAILAWNLGLPLLQPHLRKHVHRVFNLAAQVLGEISSPLAKLRAMLHLEAAKCELASDFLAKASSHVLESLKMDYGKIDEDRVIAPEMTMDEPPLFPSPPILTAEEIAQADAKNDAFRPYDRYTYPMHRKLQLRTSIYSEPDNAEEKALLQLEQAKEVSDASLQRTLLQKSAALLELSNEVAEDEDETPSSPKATSSPDVTLADICDPSKPIAFGAGETMTAPSQSVKRQTSLWSEIMTMAWSLRNVELVTRAALPVLSNVWDSANNREFVVMQVKCQFTLAESLVERLKLMGLPPLPHAATTSGDDDEDEVPTSTKRPDPRALGIPCLRGSLLAPPEKWADEADMLKRQVVGAISAGIKRAENLGTSASYLVESGAVLLWNYHIHIFRARAYSNVTDELFGALKVTHSALSTVESKDAALKAHFSEALALISEARNDLTASEQFCTESIPFGRPMQVKRLVEILARVKYAKGGKDLAPPIDLKSGQKPNPLFEVSAICVAIAQAFEKGEDTSKNERADLLKSALSTLKTYRDDRISNAEIAAKDGATMTSREDDEEALEYEAELWVRLAMESLHQELLRQAQFCCNCCVEQLPAQPELRKRVPTNVWRWYSCAESIFGRAIAAMVDTDGQDRTLQDELRRTSLKHLVTAARHGSRARQPNLVFSSTQYLWNIALPLTTSTISRKQIFPFIKAALSELKHAGVSKNPEFRVNLFILLFECYTDVEDWSGGLEAVNDAFTQIPPHLQRPLWQQRVVFMSKLGKGVLDGMQKMKESDPVLQARVWAILARAASSMKQQMSAYVQAINSLEGRFERLEYCIEMAEWMIQSGLSKKDSNDVLVAAVDAFMSVEEKAFPALLGPENEEDEDFDDVETESQRSGYVSHSNSRSGLGTSGTIVPPGTALSRASSRASMHSQGGMGGDIDPPMSAATNAPSTSQTNLRRSTSRASVRSTRSAVSSSAAGEKSKDDAIPEALNVCHMTTLIRSLAMLSKTADGFRARIETALAASHYAERCMLLAIDCANDGAAMAEYEKLNDEERLQCGGLSQFTKDFPAAYAIPSKMEEWSKFFITEEMLHHSKHVPHHRAKDVVSHSTVDKIPLNINHLFYVAEVLSEEGLTLQALPVLLLALLIAQLATATHNENLVALCGAKIATALLNLGMADSSLEILKQCGPYGMDELFAKKYKEDVEQIEIQKYGHVLTKGIENKSATIVKFSEENGHVEDARKVKVKRFEERYLWVCIAEELIKLEQPNTAAQYLEEALRHCAAFEDLGCRAKCLVAKAKVAIMNGDIEECIDSCKVAMYTLQNYGGGESSVWAESALLMSSALLGPPLYNKGEAKKVLENAYQVLLSRVKSTPEMMRFADEAGVGENNEKEVDLEAALSYAVIATAYAGCLATEAVENRSNGGPWMEIWTRSQDVLKKCAEDLATLSDGTDEHDGEVRPPQVLIDVLQFRSTLVLNMRAESEFYDDLQEGIHLLSQASKIALDNHSFSCPPENSNEPQPFAEELSDEDKNAETEEKDGEEEKSRVERVKITVPTARRAANVQIALCRLYLMAARFNHEHVSTKEAEEAYEKEVTDPVQKYLDATAPKVVTDNDVKVQNLQSALFLATSARRLAKYCPQIIAAANGVVGECLALLSSQRGLLDAPWDVEQTISASATSLGAESITPSPSAAELLVGGGDGGGKKGKGKGKDKKPAKGKDKAADDEEIDVPVVDINTLDEEVVIDETGDIRAQALALLSAAGDSLSFIGDYKSSLSAHISACDTAGSALMDGNPVEALRSLLKSQAAGCNEWLRELRVRSTETEPSGRDRLFVRRLNRCSRDRGVVESSFDEDTLFRPLVGGSHGAGSHIFPPVKAAKKYLDDFSTPWKRITNAGASGDAFVDDLLFAMPENIRMVILQLSADCTSLYCGVASKARMPSIGKVGFSADESDELQNLVAKMKQIEGSSFSKFMIRYADESGEEGDFVSVEGGQGGEVKEGIFLADEGEAELVEVIERMNKLLQATFEKPQIATALNEAKESGANIVLVPDVRLHLLPLEGLSALEGVNCVTRDFSGQIFLMRIAALAKMGQASTKSMGYVADPRLEDTGSENASKPRSTVIEVVNDLCGKGGVGGGFRGIKGDEKIPSDGDWQNFLGGKNEQEVGSPRAFMYYGPGRCLARFGIGKLTGFNLDGLMLAVLADRAENDASYRRQSKLDNQKRPPHLALEGSMESAALLSLGGCQTVVCNRWASSFHANGRFVRDFFGEVAGGGDASSGIKAYRERTHGEGDEARGLKARVKFNTVLVGLPMTKLNNK